MVNELRELLHDNADSPPADHSDLEAVLRVGRRRVRRRRMAAVGGAAIATAAVVGLASLALPGDRAEEATDGVPTPDAPTLHLSDAEHAVEGRDYRMLASHTNKNLNRANGQYFDGVTDDGLILFRDGPHFQRNGKVRQRLALMDPATGEKDWLPDLGLGQQQAWPVDLGEDRLVLLSGQGDLKMRLIAHVFDRSTRKWTRTTWSDLPRIEDPWRSAMGPDGRLYVSVLAEPGKVPEGGWPMENGEADDSNADGDEYRLWSASLTDNDDVRDEGVALGEFDFTDEALVWIEPDRSDGNGQIHVRDLKTGEERSFDPNSGERCNLLTFGASGDRIVLGQYCGDYEADGGRIIRDDRVQVVTTDGEQVATIQDSSIDGGLVGDTDMVTVSSYKSRREMGTYIYDLVSDRFLRVSDTISSYGVGGPTPGDMFLWHTPVGEGEEPGMLGRGAKQWLGEIIR